MKHVVMFSGGAASWGAAKRVADKYGTADLTLLFSDTMTEDDDLYRFLAEATANVGGTYVRLADGRDVWQIFHDVKFMGNSRIDPCSRILKREICHKWVEANCDPADTTLYVGIDWTETHRLPAIKRNWAPYTTIAPLAEWQPLESKDQLLKDLEEFGIKPPRLYAMGFPHNNCGGFCIKAGMAQFRILHEFFPERYAYHEQREQELREYLGKNVSILRSRKGGKSTPLTLKAFREGLEGKLIDVDPNDWGGCGCFTDEEEKAAA